MLSPSNSVSKKTSNILEFYTNNFILHTCWSYTYKRSFLLRNKLNFIRHVQNEEDNLFTAKAFCICKKFLFYKKPLYCKRLGAGLLSNQMGYTQCVYLMKVVNEMYLFVKKKKLTNEQKEFMLYRTRDIFIAVIPRLILLNQNEILKLSKIIKSFLKNILIFKVTQERKNMIFFIKKYGPFKGLINYKKFIVNEIKLLIEDFRKKKIYVFSKSFFGISIAQLLLSYDYHVVGFLDNSKVVQGGSFPNKSTIMKFRFLKVFSPIILKGKSKRQLSKFFFIISNQKKPDIQNIRNQLKKYKINKKQIGNIFFRNFA